MEKLSSDLVEYLELCGMPRRVVARCKSETRMYHDLGIYGDIAEAYIDVLGSKYSVDLAGFEFDKFFPPEVLGRSLLANVFFSFVPFSGQIVRRRGQWLPLTLGRIDSAIRLKRWE